MSYELFALVLATFLGLVYLSAAAFSLKTQYSNSYLVGPRDDGVTPEKMAGRLERARRNFMETYPFFAVFTILVHLTGSENAWTWWGCTLYLGGRTLFLPLYALGIPWLRSVSWNVATLGMVIVGLQLLN